MKQALKGQLFCKKMMKNNEEFSRIVYFSITKRKEHVFYADLNDIVFFILILCNLHI